MSIITLTSDWGIKDHYLAISKGSILSKIPDATIIDISHQIPPFNIHQASFIIRNTYKSFPPGSIHIVSINTDASIESPHIAIFHNGHYFIGADNGIFSLIFDEKPEKIIELEIYQDSDYFTFSTRDIFVKTAVHLAQGKDFTELGSPKDALLRKMSFNPVVEKDVIKGKVIYIDGYENVIINVTESLFKEVGKGRKFSIIIKIRGYEINSISKSYQDVPLGEMLAIFGSNGYLEIAINQGNAGSLLGLKNDDIIRIEFEEE